MFAATTPLAAESVAIALPPDAPESIRSAAGDLATSLGRLFPGDDFPLAAKLPGTGKAILIGSVTDHLVKTHLGEDPPAAPESFVVRTRQAGEVALGIIAGADARGTAFGVYQLLSRLGCGFHLSGDTYPAPRKGSFDFSGWNLENAPLTPERIVFNWHNFLSGCSTWNPPEWRQWTAQARKMGFNAIMVHSYGNNPMAGFDFMGKPKPVGWLSTTARGRDWSTMHVADVRELAGGRVFNQPVFGADAAMVPDEQRVAAARSLMRDVFSHADQLGMDIHFAVDVDTPSANPQELVTLLPESARFQVKGVSSNNSGQAPERIWLPNPDTPGGYAFYRSQVEALMNAYPQITRLVVWFRRDATPWMGLKPADFPPEWRKQYASEIARTPEVAEWWNAPGLFAIGQIVQAFERALVDCQATRTRVAAGSWSLEFLAGADRFFPSGVPLIGLDYKVLEGKPQLGDKESRALLREVGKRRPVIPVVWAHHDDGHYVGRPYTPLAGFSSKLEDARSSGFGIIHWTTRPLDLYFESLAKQVWQTTKDQALPETCHHFAVKMYGDRNAKTMGHYLESWITGSPAFGRETSDQFIDRKLDPIDKVAAGCRSRLKMIAKADTTGLSADQRQRLDYQRGLEEFTAAFHRAQGSFQASCKSLQAGNLPAARKDMVSRDPQSVIDGFARFSSIGGITRGEQGLIVSLNTRWLSHIVSHRQALGMDAVRIDFAPTSHDPLAQFPGTFTFRMDHERRLWQVLGARETGADAVTLPASLSDGMNKHEPESEAWRATVRHGIEISRPITLHLGPILSDCRRKPDKRQHQLPAGDYTLRLALFDSAPRASAARLVDVEIARQPVTPEEPTAPAAGGGRIRQISFPVTLESAGTIELTIRPLKEKAILCAAVLEP